MPIEAPLPLVLWCLSYGLPLVHRLDVAPPVVVCLRLASPFVVQPPHASIADCHVAYIRTASAYQCAAASQLAVSLTSMSTSVAIVIVIVIVSCRAIAIVVNFVACRVVAIGNGLFFDAHAHFVLHT